MWVVKTYLTIKINRIDGFANQTGGGWVGPQFQTPSHYPCYSKAHLSPKPPVSFVKSKRICARAAWEINIVKVLNDCTSSSKEMLL